ncbi:Inner membrane transporter YcaM [Lactobacillus helveticus]|nr:hypothetical protein HMPREF0518_1238 [Lactobacillus helveticus DSM 20075 = CGMCC 1.1877]KRL32926.1 amino acid permease [Lactobacillus helveticus DSM 20075 = CGMCC 1.1877]CDI61924.1 Amino acid permease [Lactobacillus helveticus CIRM-BIA 103]SPS13567.1 Inner membrane transporter YcaM [Lactobacillus helveticus]
MIVVLSGGLIAIQAFVPNAQAVMAQLVKLNSTTMPLRYLWVFAAYIALRKHQKSFETTYQMTKYQGLAYTAGIWCFLVTTACCIFGIYSPDPFTLMLNILTPIILIALGLILPGIDKYHETKAN